MIFKKIKSIADVARTLLGAKLKSFILCMVILICFQSVFGSDNTFLGISLATALLTYYYIDIGISPPVASVCLFFLFFLVGLSSWANQLGVWISIPINFLTVYIVMVCTSMPIIQKPYIPLILCFIFIQGNPVTGSASIRRMAAFLFVGIVVAVCYYIFHRKHSQKRTIKDIWKEAFRFSTRTQFALRMAAGLTLAMFIGGVSQCDRPMWIGIVTFAVTQPFLEDTVKRMAHRVLGCLAGTVCFFLLFHYLIDPKYSMVVLMICGFLSSVPSQYGIQQIFVTINALGAAMILLNPAQSILLRLLFLGVGIVIALCCFLIMNKLIIPLHHSKLMPTEN